MFIITEYHISKYRLKREDLDKMADIVDGNISIFETRLFYTKQGQNVTARVMNGRTELIKMEDIALEKADEIHSYRYPVFNEEGEQIYWGVPK